MSTNKPWWSEEYGFFGHHYIEGDNSLDGYLIGRKQDLRDRTITEVDGIVRLLNLQGNERILDVPSGYGRHSIELAKRGFSVTGLELNSIHIDKAISDAKSVNVNVRFVKGNMIDIPFQREFNVVINMFYSFGFFETDAENSKVLEGIYDALAPGGQFLFHTDVNISRIISGKYREDENRRLESGKSLRIIDAYDPNTKRINGAWIITDSYHSEIRKNYSVRVYTAQEFTEFCRQVGFEHFQIFGDWDLTPYSDESEDMIIIAHKGV